MFKRYKIPHLKNYQTAKVFVMYRTVVTVIEETAHSENSFLLYYATFSILLLSCT